MIIAAISLVIAIVCIIVWLSIKPITIKKNTICTKEEKGSSISRPITGVDTFGPSSDHTIYDCDNFEYIYRINNVQYSKEGKIIKDSIYREAEDSISHTYEVKESSTTKFILLAVAFLFFFISGVAFWYEMNKPSKVTIASNNGKPNNNGKSNNK
jgi:hypothetical protein